MQNSVLVGYDQFLFHEGNIVIFFILLFLYLNLALLHSYTKNIPIQDWDLWNAPLSANPLLRTRVHYDCLYLLRQRTSLPAPCTQSHNTHLHEVQFMSIISSPLTLMRLILRHNARARYVVTCTLRHMRAAAASQAAPVSALQLTPDILAAH
jgi:hypothetical protein